MPILEKRQNQRLVASIPYLQSPTRHAKLRPPAHGISVLGVEKNGMRESTWLVVADGSRAHVYNLSGPKLKPSLNPIDTLEDPTARRQHDPSDSGMHFSFTDLQGPKAEHQKRFVRRLVRRLRQGHQRGAFRSLYVAAPAGFIGKLRGLYSPALADCVRREIIGDYTQVKVSDLHTRVRKWIN